MNGMNHFQRGFIDRARQHGMTDKQAYQLLEDPSVQQGLGAVGLGGGAFAGHSALTEAMPDIAKRLRGATGSLGRWGGQSLADSGWRLGERFPLKTELISRATKIVGGLGRHIGNNPRLAAAGMLAPLVAGGAYGLSRIGQNETPLDKIKRTLG
jgi:hypothetical protein